MTKEEEQVYINEITYQKHMIDNLGRWLTLSILVSSIGVLLVYFYYAKLFLRIIGIAMIFIGVLAAYTFGMGVYKGTKNVNKIIDDYEFKKKQTS